jgi:glycosyltransferase involved in cell wall biosynthesis
MGLVNDPWLCTHADIEYLNTSPRQGKTPAALTAGNVRLVARHATQVFRAAGRSEVVHFNLAPVPLLPLIRAVVLAAAAKLRGAAVVMHAHTGRLQAGVDRTLYRTVLRMTRRLFDALVVVSEGGRLAARRAGIDAVLIQNGVRVGDFASGPKSDGRPDVVFVGTVCERKGLLDLRDALVALRRGGALPSQVVIVGDGSQEGPGAFERIRAAYAEAGLAEVEFAGALEPPEVRDALARAAIFCLPSHWEGGPLSVLEAMASQAAVVATRVGEIPAMLDGGEAGVLVDPHAPRQLAGALARLLGDPAERSRLGAAARERVTERYSWDGTTRKLFEIYSKLSKPMLSRRVRAV